MTASTNAAAALRAGATSQGLTDLGNAERLARMNSDTIRYCAPWKKWLIWDGSCWRVDETGEIQRRAKAAVLALYAEAAEEVDGSRRQQLVSWAKYCEKAKALTDMVKLATSEEGMPVHPDELDRAEWSLVCDNGTIDLRTGQLRASRPEDYATKVAPVTFNPDATCPLWLAFLDKIFAGDAELIAFVRRAVGYSLTGSTREQVMILAEGGGRNGKSTLLETLAALLGGYSQKTPADTLLVRREGSVPNDLARMRGARLVVAVETGEGKRLDEARVKELTGGDTITARFLHGEFFEFRPVAKIWLATNHRPRIMGGDLGIWRRILTLPFRVTIRPDEVDPDLPERLLQELPGILAWAVAGCLDWQAGGLRVPSTVREATEAYRQEQDSVGAFLEECTEEAPEEWLGATELYASYVQWAKAAGEHPMTQKSLGMRLTDRGLTRAKHGPARRWAWKGLKRSAQAPLTAVQAPLTAIDLF